MYLLKSISIDFLITSGSYLLLSSTAETDPNMFAILRSPLFSSSKRYGCLSFFYNMHGETVGSLEISYLEVS